MKNNRRIEKRNNVVMVVDYPGSAPSLVAKFETDGTGKLTRTYSSYASVPHAVFNNIEDVRQYYGVPLNAYVYYKALEEDKNGEYIEVPTCYEIEEEVPNSETPRITQYPITVTQNGERLVSDKLLHKIAALKNKDYNVTILY